MYIDGIVQIKIHIPQSTSPILLQAAFCPLPLLLNSLLLPLLARLLLQVRLLPLLLARLLPWLLPLARLLPLLLAQLLPAPLLALLGSNYLKVAGNKRLH